MLIIELLAIAYAVGWIRLFVRARGYAAGGGEYRSVFSSLGVATIWPLVAIAGDYASGKKFAQAEAKSAEADLRMRDADARLASLDAAAARLKEKLREVEARHA